MKRRQKITPKEYLDCFDSWLTAAEDYLENRVYHEGFDIEVFRGCLYAWYKTQLDTDERKLINRMCTELWETMVQRLDSKRAQRMVITITKSNLLARLIYGGQEVRTVPCPKCRGRWGADIFHADCQGTGWLPNEADVPLKDLLPAIPQCTEEIFDGASGNMSRCKLDAPHTGISHTDGCLCWWTPDIGSEWRHLKRGSTYTITGKGTLQTEDRNMDNAKVVIYQAKDGTIWVRPEDEFLDGRFEAVGTWAYDAS